MCLTRVDDFLEHGGSGASRINDFTILFSRFSRNQRFHDRAFFLGKGVLGNFFKFFSCSIARSLPENLLENYKKFARKLPDATRYKMSTRFGTRRKLTEQYNVCLPLETDIQKYLTKFEAAELKCKIFNLFECVIADHSLNSHLNNYQYSLLSKKYTF